MRLGGTGAYLVEVHNRDEVPEAIAWADAHKVPVIMIGQGSNIVWRDEGFPGLIIVNKIRRFETFEEDESNMYITVGAGELWDEVVAKTVAMGYSGIEQLSLIPGTAGATPIQNVGAYGREIADVLVTVEAYDRVENRLVTIPASDCGFDYRTSRFKTTDKRRFFITAITLRITKIPPMPPFYASLQAYLAEHDIHNYTPEAIRNAVIAIRTAKLPDPAVISNNGSFFANPVVDNVMFKSIHNDYPDIKYWRTDSGQVKFSAAWLLERCGFKGIHDKETGMATWPSQPLVLVNEQAAHTADLLKFRQKIIDAVRTKFGITLEQEPELLP